MKKTYVIEDLCCGHCAKKIEDGILKIEGVTSANVSFIMQKLTVEADDEKFDDIMKQVVKLAKKIEPECRIKL